MPTCACDKLRHATRPHNTSQMAPRIMSTTNCNFKPQGSNSLQFSALSIVLDIQYCCFGIKITRFVIFTDSFGYLFGARYYFLTPEAKRGIMRLKFNVWIFKRKYLISKIEHKNKRSQLSESPPFWNELFQLGTYIPTLLAPIAINPSAGPVHSPLLTLYYSTYCVKMSSMKHLLKK